MLHFFNVFGATDEPRNQFTIRFAPVIYLAGIFVGAIGGEAGLGLAGSVTAILAINLLGSIGTGSCAVMGPRAGHASDPHGPRRLRLHRNYLPAALSVLVYVGYYTNGTILGATALADLFGLPYIPMVVVVAALSWRSASTATTCCGGKPVARRSSCGLAQRAMSGTVITLSR
jgi:nucleobase:cation symporter-1, NCS1 family